MRLLQLQPAGRRGHQVHGSDWKCPELSSWNKGAQAQGLSLLPKQPEKQREPEPPGEPLTLLGPSFALCLPGP